MVLTSKDGVVIEFKMWYIVKDKICIKESNYVYDDIFENSS